MGVSYGLQATLLISTFLTLPFWFVLMQRFGKRNTYLFGLLASCLSCSERHIVTFAWQIGLPGNFFYFVLPKNCEEWQLYLMCVVGSPRSAIFIMPINRCHATGGISLGAAYLLPWSMLPDVIDDIGLCY